MNMTIDITEIVVAVIGLVAAALTAYVVPAIKTWLKSKIDANTLEKAKVIVRAAVLAAEQTIKAEDGENIGEEKKEYVMDVLAKQNLKLDIDVIDALVESYVAELNSIILK